MHKEKINKSTVGIAFLLILVLAGGLLVEFAFAYENACTYPKKDPTLRGDVKDTQGDPIKGVNVTVYTGGQSVCSITTSTLGGYIFYLTLPTNPANLDLIVKKNGISNSESFQISCSEDKIKNMILGLGKPDITINSSDIHFNPESPAEFQSVTITALIHNAGNSSVGAEGVEDLNVSFYKDNLSNLIGSDMIELPANSQSTASINWTAKIGNHTIIVVTDADLQIYETNETNNQVNKTINIASTENFIKQDNIVFRYLYASTSEESLIYLPELENLLGKRILIEKSCPPVNCGLSDFSGFFNSWYSICSSHGYPTIPLTMSIGKKSINSTGDIDYNKVNYTSDFNETNNQTLNQWIKNICYQFEVKPDVCLPCDLNGDGVVIKDYDELMAAYKCFLGMGGNCRDLNGDGITFQDWREMKHEYECFNGLAYFSNIK